MKKTVMMAAAALMTATGVASAAALYNSTGTPGNWNNSACWTYVSGSPVGTFPAAGDAAVIDDAVLITVSSSTSASSVEVSNGGTLEVGSGQTFTVAGGFVDANSFVVVDDGTLTLTGPFVVRDEATLIMEGAQPRLDIDVANGLQLEDDESRVEIMSVDARLMGPGSLQGQDPASSLTINVQNAGNFNLTIESDAIVHGDLTITADPNGGTGKLHNAGRVIADVSALTLTNLDDITDDDTGRSCASSNWQSISGALLAFESLPQNTLGGFFLVDSVSFLEIDFGAGTITTTGKKNIVSGGTVSGTLNADPNPCP